MTLFRLDASIRAEGSHSAAVADIVEGEWRKVHVNEPVVRRQIGLDPIPSTTWSAAVHGSRTAEASRTPDQSAAVAMAADLTDELAAADSLLFAVPLYNFGISQHFKAWVDLVITDPRMAAGSAPLLADKPAVLVVARGGATRPGRRVRGGTTRRDGSVGSSLTSGSWTCPLSRPSSPSSASTQRSKSSLRSRNSNAKRQTAMPMSWAERSLWDPSEHRSERPDPFVDFTDKSKNTLWR